MQKRRADQQLLVLVVDDNFYNIVAITSMFQQYQIETDATTDGKEAISLV